MSVPPAGAVGPASIYGASPVRRSRRTQAQLAELDDAIVAAVEADWPVSLRGVYYRVVSAGAVPKTEAAYRTVGRRLLHLRRTGRIGYDRITDGTRWVIAPTVFDSVDDVLWEVARTYRRDLWRDQDTEVHIFTEKDAITRVISSATARWGVPLAVLRGYCSETFAHEMAAAIDRAGKPVFVYQLGDHDPDGVAAWADFQRKVRGFAPDAEVTFRRLAVIPEQVEEMGLPTRPTKRTSRSREFLGESVDVDAIPARVLRELVLDASEQHIDPHRLEVLQAVEREERAGLYALARGGWSA